MSDQLDSPTGGADPSAPSGVEAADPRLTSEPGAMAAGEVLDALGQAVIVTDPGGRIVYWNSAAEELYGWPAAEVLGRDVTEVTVPLMSQEVGAQVMEALRSGTPWSGWFPVQRRDGAMFPALVTDAGIYRGGTLVGIVGESMNLGAAVRPLLERSSDAAVMLTADGIVTYASPAVTGLFGWGPEELIGKPLTDRVHPEDQETLRELMQGEGEDPAVPTWVGEVRIGSAEGWTWVEAALSNVVTDPDVRGLVCNLRRSERLTQIDERERLIRAMHVSVLQELFAATLELDHTLLRATPAQRPTLESAIDAIGRAIHVLREAVKPPER